MATIAGTIQASDGTAIETRLTFISISQPTISGTVVYSKSIITAYSDVDGNFSQVLAQGDYRVVWQNTIDVTRVETTVIITVPAGSGTHRFEDCINDELTYTATTNPQYMLANPADAGVRFRDGWFDFYNTELGAWVRPFVAGATATEQHWEFQVLAS